MLHDSFGEDLEVDSVEKKLEPVVYIETWIFFLLLFQLLSGSSILKAN